MMSFKSLLLTAFSGIILVSCNNAVLSASHVTMSEDELLDKIKGGWAGQAIGCTFGGPTEFQYVGTIIGPEVKLDWPDHCLKYYYDNFPGLYDDIYMDLTFVKVFEEEGLDAPSSSFANAFANADYLLWHANQQARYNIRQGMMPPESGYWENNPHADDIDFQIEADYAGLMAPGMPRAASFYTDSIGHIMNYGDGWYGGVYVANMYSLAFVCNDVKTIVTEALESIPQQSRFYKCIHDVIDWHERYPEDWVLAWSLVLEHWNHDIGCPSGINEPFNIDAVTNSAYIVIGLLYGDGDFEKTMEIAARCGQDSDCNPASAAGILGTMLGYSNIPSKWMANLHEVEDLNFDHTDISLNDVYQMSFSQACQVIRRNGGSVTDGVVTIELQKPEAVRYEESFSGHIPDISQSWFGKIPYSSRRAEKQLSEEIRFTGKGIVVTYGGLDREYVIDAFIDGTLVETIVLPQRHQYRKQELFYRYNLPDTTHILTFRPHETPCPAVITSYIVY